MTEPEIEATRPTSGDSKPPVGPDIDYYTERWAKGEYVDGGVSGVVELLPNGYIVKSPWNGWWEEEECREDMAREARAYQRLLEYFGAHERFVRIVSHDETDYSITMEYMVNGTLRAYVEVHNDHISQDQRHQWILAMAEGMEMLHAASVVHCDFSPRNMLLDGDLELKVTDFGCVSMDGSDSSAGGSVRFYPPRALSRERFDVDDDVFALGSSIYEVSTGKPPYADLQTVPTRNLYSLQQVSDLVGLDMSDIIRDCWLLRAQSAREIHQRILAVVRARARSTILNDHPSASPFHFQAMYMALRVTQYPRTYYPLHGTLQSVKAACSDDEPGISLLSSAYSLPSPADSGMVFPSRVHLGIAGTPP
ncbi:hypothetical protein LTS09_004871 [Friedmanniomyces endolithicus]|nr:hypothetical protein LTS09_004871 [Friedmanniomyces endolithicus]